MKTRNLKGMPDKDKRVYQKRLIRAIIMGSIILIVNAYMTVSGITSSLVR